MSVIPIPSNEQARLDMLRMYSILDSSPDDTFDDISAEAASSFKVPIALITLVDAHRVWFKSCVGLDSSAVDRRDGFCTYTILDNTPLVIPDARQDPRFAFNPLVVGPPYIRFYAGAPLLVAEGCALGSLCLIDQQPRTLTEPELAKLVRLANTVVLRLKIRLTGLTLSRMNSTIEELNRLTRSTGS